MPMTMPLLAPLGDAPRAAIRARSPLQGFILDGRIRAEARAVGLGRRPPVRRDHLPPRSRRLAHTTVRAITDVIAAAPAAEEA
jgi:hypothetical protein